MWRHTTRLCMRCATNPPQRLSPEPAAWKHCGELFWKPPPICCRAAGWCSNTALARPPRLPARLWMPAMLAYAAMPILQAATASPRRSGHDGLCREIESTRNTPMVRFETSHGGFTVELYHEDAPQTVENFLRYVDDGFFDGTIFHRIVPGFVIQGGGLTTDFGHKKTHPLLKSEAAIR